MKEFEITTQQCTTQQRKTLLVPFDYSPHSHAAVETATDLAVRLGGDIQLLHVVQPPAYGYGGATARGPLQVNADSMTRREAVARDLNVIAQAIGERVDRVGLEVVAGSRPASMIRSYAERIDADMIVMGTHGRSGLARRFLGGVAQRTLHGAPCPVLSVRSPDEGAPDAQDRERNREKETNRSPGLRGMNPSRGSRSPNSKERPNSKEVQ